jgi:hypothetical protein
VDHSSTPQDQLYLTKNWDVLAALAWREYTVHGRGAVLVQNVGQRDEHCVYLPVKLLDRPLVTQYALPAAKYNPRQEIVVILMRQASTIRVYKGAMPGRETPVEAHGRLEAVLFPDLANLHGWAK